VLALVLLAAVVAAVLVSGGVSAGWLVLGLVVVAGPVTVMVDGRARNQAAPAVEAGAPVSEPARFPSASPATPEQPPYRAAA
jgi:hypothetical protein